MANAKMQEYVHILEGGEIKICFWIASSERKILLMTGGHQKLGTGYDQEFEMGAKSFLNSPKSERSLSKKHFHCAA